MLFTIRLVCVLCLWKGYLQRFCRAAPVQTGDETYGHGVNNGRRINLASDRDKITVEKINELKKERNAVILAHNYQLAEVQDCADFLGDSLELSQKAAQTDADVIVFCGVHFMAETASILCPDKMVLLPDINAGCPMANMINAEQLREVKDVIREHWWLPMLTQLQRSRQKATIAAHRAMR